MAAGQRYTVEEMAKIHRELAEFMAPARAAQRQLGLSFSEISRRTGIGTNQVMMVMTGRRNATYSTQRDILRAVGLELCVKPIEGGGNEKAA